MSAGCYHAPDDPARVNRNGRRVQMRRAQRVEVTEEPLVDEQ